MSFTFRNASLYCEEVALADIAESVGTPCYVYAAGTILANYQAYDTAFGELPHTVCYAVKANSNLAVLRLLAEAGAGFDIVSGGELFRVLKAGGDPAKVVFSGVGKTRDEIDYALDQGVFGFHSESESELALIDALAARRGVTARIALRVNPDVDAATHPYISTGLSEHKFGIDISEVEGVYERALAFKNLRPESVSCHIGSQILDTKPLNEAIDKMLALVERLRAKGLPIRHIDLGGGLGVAYKPEDATPQISRFIGTMRERLAGRDLHAMIEPGRSIVGEAGVLVTRVLNRKRNGSKEFVIVDAGMNDLIRPSLYKAHHEIVPLRQNSLPAFKADVVGPVCESGDFFALGREIATVLPGDLVALKTAGAYGFVLSSNYNSRPRVAEVLVEGNAWRVVRRRETFEDLIRGEE
ncbi:MAG: diaminopimelate decarboxylase [Bryobacteraceae bacterium]